MIIHSADFIKSSPSIKECPPPSKPEFGFIGRSNVGKSSLINMLTGWSKLAKISVKPGKTRTINHFSINDKWYLVDLPGFGYAKVPLKEREKWMKTTEQYILNRTNLVSLFMLIDIRHKPQRSDLGFMEFLGNNDISFARVFTKSDKISALAVQTMIGQYNEEMLKNWESLPVTFIASSVKGTGREEILSYIESCMSEFLKTDIVI